MFLESFFVVVDDDDVGVGVSVGVAVLVALVVVLPESSPWSQDKLPR